jgi:AmmeMemoRadiSam system protein A
MADEWSGKEKEALLLLARKAIESHLAKVEADANLTESVEVTERMEREDRGVFVTIRKKGRLKGCIGYIKPYGPLYKMVADMAVRSATGDPRFKPLEPEELKDCAIEISCLSPFEKVTEVAEIEVGRDGLMISKGFYQGLLLPQVAVEHGWDREEFLEETCLKAGLPRDAWKDKAEIEKFSATVFGDEERGDSGEKVD